MPISMMLTQLYVINGANSGKPWQKVLLKPQAARIAPST